MPPYTHGPPWARDSFSNLRKRSDAGSFGLRSSAGPIVERRYSGQRLALEQLQRRTTACRHVAHCVLEAQLGNGGCRVASANYRRRTSLRGAGHGLGNRPRARVEGWFLEHAHRTIPDNRPRIRDDVGELTGGVRAYVEHAFVTRNAVATYSMSPGSLLEGRRHSRVVWQLELLAASLEQLPGHVDSILLDE